jgi:hypothetical protein
MADVLDYDKPMIIFDYWGTEENDSAFISFNGPLAPNEYFFEMKNIAEAERLAEFLTERTPISLYRPFGRPVDK